MRMRIKNALFTRAVLLVILFSAVVFVSANAQDKTACPTVEISGTDVTCYNATDGKASVSVSDGSGDYTIEWDHGVIGDYSISDLSAGIYKVSVLDNISGCVVDKAITIRRPDKLETELDVSHVDCYGQSTGSISTAVSGGTSPYNYSWSNGETSENLSGITAGDYTITVTDDNGCLTTNSTQVDQPKQALGTSYRVTDVLCKDDTNGAVDVDVWGGTPPYTYNWNGNAFTSQDLSNISAGTYDLTITDNNDCTVSETVVLSNPEALQLTSQVIDNLCYGQAKGEINLNVSGGTEPYNYTWSNSEYTLGFDGPNFTGLTSDEYSVIIEDANGCTKQDNYVITSPEELVTEISGTNVSSTGGSDGQIELSVTGGVEPYSYDWSNGVSGQNNEDVPAGLYEVIVRDANNCTAENSIYISEPSEPLKFSYIKTDASCHGADDGEIFVFPAGGTEPYSFLWSAGSTESYLTDLSAGKYILTLTDANDVKFTDTITIQQPDAFSFSHAGTSPSCKGFSDGEIQLSVSGGTKPYEYHWYDSDFALAGMSNTLSDAKADSYTVEVRDSLGCKANYSVVLSEPEQLVLSIEEDHVQCAGGSSGSIHTNVSGGTLPYTYNWSNGSSEPDALNLKAGRHKLTVADANGCLVHTEVLISEADPIKINLFPEQVSCIDQTDGSVSSDVTGGNGGYAYDWSNGETGEEITGLRSGTYSLQVTDILGCTNADTTFVDKKNVACLFIPSVFTPNADGINDLWIIDNISVYPDCLMQIFNKWGNLLYESKGYNQPWDGTDNGKQLPPGTYYYVLSFSQDLEPRKGTVTIVK